MTYLTIQGITNDLAKALQREKQRRGKSLNQTVIELLRQSLGIT
jgi:predicted HicB family RNase H-like nuclease